MDSELLRGIFQSPGPTPAPVNGSLTDDHHEDHENDSHGPVLALQDVNYTVKYRSECSSSKRCIIERNQKTQLLSHIYEIVAVLCLYDSVCLSVCLSVFLSLCV